MIVKVFNMTGFFNRELFMYALGDIRFKKPVSMKKVAYITFFLIIWIFPIVSIFGLHFKIWYMAILLIPPIVLGNQASRPVWGGGRGLFDYLKIIIDFIKQPRGWTDHKEDNDLESQTFYVEDEIWVSRRREIIKLARENRELRESRVPKKQKKKKRVK